MKIVTNSELVKRYLLKHHQMTLVESERIIKDRYTGQFKLIVVDVDSAEGVYTSKIIRENNPKIPIIGVSEDLPLEGEWPEKRSLFIENGGGYLLQSPINPREMLACINASRRRY